MYYSDWLDYDKKVPTLRDLATSLKHFICQRKIPATQDKANLLYHLFGCISHQQAVCEALGVIGGDRSECPETWMPVAHRLLEITAEDVVNN